MLCSENLSFVHDVKKSGNIKYMRIEFPGSRSIHVPVSEHTENVENGDPSQASTPLAKQLIGNYSSSKEFGVPQDIKTSDRPRRSSSLSDTDRRLAAYVFARTVDNRLPNDIELGMLREANVSIKETQKLLSEGRGNVRSDLDRTQNDSFFRSFAMRSTLQKVRLSSAQRAALAVHARAGNCGEHSDVLMHVHAEKLSAGDRLHDVYNFIEDHEAVILEGAGERPDILLDVWGSRHRTSAMNVIDSKYHNDARDLETIGTLTQKTGLEASSEFKGSLSNGINEAKGVFDAELKRARERGTKSVGARDSNVFNEAFAARVKAKVAENDPAKNLHFALNAAISIGASSSSASRAAPEIIQIASDLIRSD
ncbi:hypothetical protein HX776_09675 [Pseudomonas agarici]|nr:hypothetical protein [Pseudomonas agarici]NWC09084.1 hypothetical protein [Pseudomonas agarici]